MEKRIAAFVLISGLCWPAAVRAEVVLEASEIDISTVEVGALAVVIHMQDKPHPILREWEQLVTTRGYVQSVDAEVLTLVLERNGRPQRIAVDRIQRLTLMGAPSSETVERNSAQVAVSRADGGFEGTLDTLSVGTDYKADTRMGKKLVTGVLGGIGGGLVGGALMVSGDDGDFGNEIPALFGFWGGNLVGTAAGVSWVDPQDNFLKVLAEPRLANEPSLAASDDSLSAQTKTIETSLDYWIGRIEQDTTWRDTVYVGGDVTIASGAILTLAPDTQVHFLPYHDDTQGGLDSTRAELIVEGQLHAHAGGIVFRSAATTSLVQLSA